MSSIYKHKHRGWYCCVNLPSGRRCQLYLGSITKAGAETIRRNVERLMASNTVGIEPDVQIQTWISFCDSAFRTKLEAAGLLANWKPPEQSPKLSIVWDAYMDKRADFAESSKKGFRTARKHAVDHLGDRIISEITVADAKHFALKMESMFASAHAKKIVERVKQVMQDAVDSRLLGTNPFVAVNIRARLDKTKGHHLRESDALLVLDKMGSIQAKAAFVLARFAGLRIPHEILPLTWQHIDFEKHRITIPKGTKTGMRVVPMVPLVYKHMLELAEAADSSPWVFSRGRASAGTTLRRWLESAILLAGLKQWPKLWHNLRASCRTDLEEKFASHVCDAWLGHSTRVAKDHYLMVTDEHWAQAVATLPTSKDPEKANK
jgi:integrase